MKHFVPLVPALGLPELGKLLHCFYSFSLLPQILQDLVNQLKLTIRVEWTLRIQIQYTPTPLHATTELSCVTDSHWQPA